MEKFNAKFVRYSGDGYSKMNFYNLKQGSITVTEAVIKFNQLARLYPHLMPIEEERVRHLMMMFKLGLTMAIDSGI